MSENARYCIWLQNALGYGAKIKSIIDEIKTGTAVISGPCFLIPTDAPYQTCTTGT